MPVATAPHPAPTDPLAAAPGADGWGHPLRGLVEPMGARGTDLHVVTTLVPRGPRGLWRSLARAAGVDDLADDHDVVDLDALEGAHLGYLASLG